MDDFTALNRCIAEHWLGPLNADQQAYIEYATACLGQIAYDANDLAITLQSARQARDNALHVMELNRRFLTIARLAAMDVSAGNPEMLIRLGITMELVEWLGKLSDEDIALLALTLRGPIVRFSTTAFSRGAGMQSLAGQHHATALIMTRTSTKSSGRA